MLQLSVTYGAGPAGALALLLTLAGVGLFTVTDVFKWIYQFLEWLTRQLIGPVVTAAQWITYGFYYCWQWIMANGVYTFSFTQWVVQRFKEVWEQRILPSLSTLWSVSVAYASYFINVSDRVFLALRAVVVGSILSILSVAGGSLRIASLIHAGLLASRAPFLRLAVVMDGQLFALEDRVATSARALLAKVNELAAWVNHTFDASGVIREDLLAWSVQTWITSIVSAVLAVIVRPDWQAITAQLTAALPPSDYAATLTAFRSGVPVGSADYVDVLAAFAAGTVHHTPGA